MKINNCCGIISTMRKLKGMTQKELAQDICSIKELSRIESEKIYPNLYTFEKLLTKLGVDISKFIYNFTNEGEQMAYYEIFEIWDCIFEHEYKLAESKFLSFKEQSYFDPNYLFIKQFSLLCESIFLYELHGNPSEALEMAYNAIYVTVPKFDLSYIDKHVLVLEEYFIINNIALCHIALNSIDLGIDILRRLVDSLSRKHLPKEIKNRLLPTLCYNLSKFLGLQKCYAEAIDICDLGIEACRKSKTTRSLGELFYNKAYCLKFLNDITQSKKFFQHSYDMFLLAGDSKMAEAIKKNAIEKYGILVVD